MSNREIKLDYSFCTESGIGKQGLSSFDFDILKKEIKNVHEIIQENRIKNLLGFWDLPTTDRLFLEKITEISEYLKGIADTLVVLGIGGSALGITAVDTALSGTLRYFYKKQQKGMRLLVADNSDPRFFSQLLEGLVLEKTVFVTISKSGSTSETMAQFMIVFDLLNRQLGRKEAIKRSIFITDSVEGNLRLLADKCAWKCLEIPRNVGGRYSILSNVGLFPLLCAGYDIKKLLDGAKKMLVRCSSPEMINNPAYMIAGISTHYWRSGRNIFVMMPYTNDLFGFAQWFSQLWAESLGKKENENGEIINSGQTPVAAVGATDQHSQLQLYMEGPHDKLVCFIGLDDYECSIKIPTLFKEIDALSYLGGQTLASLISSELIATTVALAQEGRPSFHLFLPKLNEDTLGQLLFLMEVATVTAGYLLKINPLNQPGVELGKKFTYSLMGRKNYGKNLLEFKEKNILGKYFM